MRTGGQILIDQLALEGCRTVFTVPGESFIAALDALHDSPIRTVIRRHEGGAAMMAEATGKLTGEPGVAFVTRAPGATNAASGVYVAQHDASPMVLLIGLVERGHEGRGAFQEIDLPQMFGGIANWVDVVRAPERIPEYLARAFAAARNSRAGPSVLGLPADVMLAEAEVAEAPPAPLEPAPAPTTAQMTRLKAKIAEASRPLVIAGGGGWSIAAAAHLAKFARAFDMPVVTAFRRQDLIDNRHPSYVGNAGFGIEPKLAAAIRSADLLIVIGEGLGDVTTSGYTLIEPPRPAQHLVHVQPVPASLEQLYQPHMPIFAAPEPFLRALARSKPPPRRRWSRLRRDLRTAYEKSLKPLPTPGAVRLEEVISVLSRTLPDETIVTNGAGNYAGFLHRYFQYKGWPTQLAPTSGSMGYGVPAAIAAKLAFPERPVVALAGDGCLLMTGQELATIAQYRLPVVIIVANNGMYGTIRMHQERRYPGRVVGTTLVNPDFVSFARSFGIRAERVTTGEAFEPALQRALSAGVATLIELPIDPEAVSVRQTLSQIRDASK